MNTHAQYKPVFGVDHRDNVIITLGEYQLTLVTRTPNDPYRLRKTRVFGAVDTLGAELNERLDAIVWEGFGHLSESQRAANNDAYRRTRRQLLRYVHAQLTDILTLFHGAIPTLINLETDGVRFSDNAGCAMCKCSPGHVLSDCATYRGEPVDLWLDSVIKSDDE